MDRMTLDRSVTGSTPNALATEWLITNGLGGFASGTVALANTRRYHGILVAALQPPVDRKLLLSKLDVTAEYRGRRYELGCNEFSDGTLTSGGLSWLHDFRIENRCPVWTYQFGDALLEQRIAMIQGENRTEVAFKVLQADGPVRLELVPLAGIRDYHDHIRAPQALDLQCGQSHCDLITDLCHWRLEIDTGSFQQDPDWYWNFHHRNEQARGLDSAEHLFRPGRFAAVLQSGASARFAVAAIEPPQSSRKQLTSPGRSRLLQLEGAPEWIQCLARAAEDYIVERHDATERGVTVIAGYPWFTDWGRDTMIALPGLTLPTGRFEDAAAILRTFARHLDQGMLPNRFPDSAGAAEYNTVDATLWFFHALDRYLLATQDKSLLRELLPAMIDIHDWHQRGTRHGIRIDPRDGLLQAGERGVQLTWMDARIGDWVVTPRAGKPVEINALWHFALTRLARWCRQLNRRTEASRYDQAATDVARQFRARFWNASAGCLYDVIDVDGGTESDTSIRPNQIFAVSLGQDLLDATQSHAVVATCAEHLLTPVGLRSLSPRDPRYAGRYEGGPLERDAVYHQGTVWSWLLGPYALAHHAVHHDAAAALRLLEGLRPHLTEGCVGQISEIFDGDPPHRPRGCFAQAWSVAETLRAWHELNGSNHVRNS